MPARQRVQVTTTRAPPVSQIASCEALVDVGLKRPRPPNCAFRTRAATARAPGASRAGASQSIGTCRGPYSATLPLHRRSGHGNQTSASGVEQPHSALLATADVALPSGSDGHLGADASTSRNERSTRLVDGSSGADEGAAGQAGFRNIAVTRSGSAASSASSAVTRRPIVAGSPRGNWRSVVKARDGRGCAAARACASRRRKSRTFSDTSALWSAMAAATPLRPARLQARDMPDRAQWRHRGLGLGVVRRWLARTSRRAAASSEQAPLILERSLELLCLLLIGCDELVYLVRVLAVVAHR